MVTFQEFGDPQNKIIVLLPPACVTWELWREYIDRLKDRYRIIAPNPTGRVNGECYTGIADNARQISTWLRQLNQEIFLLWGVSEGATTALNILALQEISVGYTIADAPYIFEKLTIRDRVTAVKIGCFVAMLPLLSKKRKAAFLEEQKKEFGEHNGQLFCGMMASLSARTLFKEFYDCFTFTMPEETGHVQTKLGLWYGEKETEKVDNAKYLSTRFPNASIKIFPGYGHAEYWMKDADGYLRDIADFTQEMGLVPNPSE
jgi:pimeloyl-ACP methyl ester carboxylesterase